MILIDLNVAVPLNDFIVKLKRWTSAWILERSSAKDATASYWTDKGYFRVISPEDKVGAISFMEAYQDLDNGEGLDAFVKRCAMFYIEDAESLSPNDSITTCYHISLLTSRGGRLLLPLKHRTTLTELICDVVDSLGHKTIACASMHNHVHMLCRISAQTAISTFIKQLSHLALERIHNNRHFRRFEG